MRLLLVNLTPDNIMVTYMLSSYTLKAYLDKYCEAGGLSTHVLNIKTTCDTETICSKILAFHPDCVGYSCYSWNIEKALDSIHALKKKTEATVILGGPEISLSRIRMLHDPFASDYYCIGEGERKLAGLIKYISDSGAAASTRPPDGIAIWNGDDIEYSCSENSISDLDEIPSVYLSGTVGEEYYAGKIAYIETQRGCRNKCGYCVYHKITASISYYSLERIYDELKFLIADRKIGILFIVDAVFSSDLDRSKKILSLMLEIRDKYKVELPLLSISYTYDSVDDEFLALAAEIGKRNERASGKKEHKEALEQDAEDIVLNNIGIQSFNDETLRSIGRKRVDWRKYGEFHNTSNRLGLAFKIDLIFGLPFETAETFIGGVGAFLKYLEGTRHNLHIQKLQVLPGSALESLAPSYRMNFMKNSPRYIISTNTMTEDEMNHASKLVAILSRIINSPLRQTFMDTVRRKTVDECLSIIESIYNGILSSSNFRSTHLVRSKSVNELYWYRKAYEELPAEWLKEQLENM